MDTYYQLCTDTRRNIGNLSRVNDDNDKWQARVRKIYAVREDGNDDISPTNKGVASNRRVYDRIFQLLTHTIKKHTYKPS